MCFCESRRTLNEAVLTSCLRTLQSAQMREKRRCNLHDHASAPDVALADEDTSVVDGLGQTELEHLGLQAAVKEVLGLETQHVVELQLGLVQDAIANQAPQNGITLEQTLGVLYVCTSMCKRGKIDKTLCTPSRRASGAHEQPCGSWQECT